MGKKFEGLIAVINPTREKHTINEVLDKAFESSDLCYKVCKQNEVNKDNNEEAISEAIKNTPKLEVELKNVDYYA